MSRKLIFVTGGARSGKSSFAENWAMEFGNKTLFIATAERSDEEMVDRINKHRESRPDDWETIEAPLNISKHLKSHHKNFDTIILDCITLLSSNAILKLPENPTQNDSDEAILYQIDDLLKAYSKSSSTWLVVSNEVGLGIVPAYKLGRLFRDSLGRANQKIAKAADEVILMVSGIPMYIKKQKI
tara:strand:- start:1025 stop:1579 length:555 start_codon:yes stop_codon:yes gene_type:complete